MPFISQNSGLSVNEEIVSKKQLIPANIIPVFDVDGKMISSGIPVGSGGTSILMLPFSFTGSVSSTTGLLYKSSINNTGSGNTPTTTPFSLGINNGGNDPYLITKNSLLKRLYLTIAGGGVGTGVIGSPLYARFRLFEIQYNTRVQIGADIDIQISTTGIGTFNNNSNDAFQHAQSVVLDYPILAGRLIGIEFVNVSGNNNYLNSIRGIFLNAEIQ